MHVKRENGGLVRRVVRLLGFILSLHIHSTLSLTPLDLSGLLYSGHHR